MIIASYRPSGTKLAKFLTGANTERILLGPLSEKEAKQISEFHTAEGKPFSPSLWRQIWEKAEGNPLYVEEATKFILARGEASRGDLNLPRTRVGLILARIKKWSEHELAELRSELRLRWGGSLQSRLSTFEMQINDWLDRLETRRYLERADLAECFDELERFQTRIVELCLVGGLARPLTTRLGEAISRLYEGSYGDHCRDLLRSSRAPQDTSRAGNQALQAAKRAVDKGRLREAVRFFRVAEKILPSDHPLQKDLPINAGDANFMLGRAGEAVRLYEKAIPQNGISNPHDDAVHRLLAAQVFTGKPLDVDSFGWRKESVPWHLIWMSLGALLSKKTDTAVSIAEGGKAASPDWVTRSYAGLVGALAQLAKGSPGDTFARCADVSRGMRAGGLSVLSSGLHWVLSQVTEGPSRSRHAATCRMIGKQPGLTSGLNAFRAAVTPFPRRNAETPSSCLRRRSAVRLLEEMRVSASHWRLLRPLLNDTNSEILVAAFKIAAAVGAAKDSAFAARRLLKALRHADWAVKSEIENALVVFFETVRPIIEGEIARRHQGSDVERIVDPVLATLLRVKRRAERATGVDTR